eukprot:gb/GFBE01055822.1/.p1 GENE.gb/GFBE01055822.1/~~gb/GFBE01055822.1/.p1  ORF type:complete len:228 (+),score=43.27 gb/GFBE01055822.1/:1-684(+)
MEDQEVPICRICLESSTDEGDEFLSPCLCSGTSRHVHRRCLDQWRVSGFDPKTVTHCGTCKAQFKLRQPHDAGLGAEGEVWLEIARYVGQRFACFAAVVLILGFVPPLMLGVDDTRMFSNWFLNHMTAGTLSTFALAGGYAIVQALLSINIFGFSPDRWGLGSKDSLKCLIIIVIIVGALYLLYQLLKGIWSIAQTGRHVASANLHFVNREMRQRIVERYPVMNYDE